jgi:hypothetical protein
MTKEQAELFRSLDSFEVDMAHKRLKRKDLNEVVFARYIKEQNKGIYSKVFYKQLLSSTLVVTLCRAFTTQDSREGYHCLFRRVFQQVQKLTGHPFYFHPLHGTGVQGVVMNMDSKAYGGKY